MRHPPIPSNPVPDWLQVVSALSTPVGVILTLLAVSIALYVALGDRGRYKAEDASRRRQQARLIRVTTGRGESECRAIVTNHSRWPIFDLKIKDPELGDPGVTMQIVEHGQVATADTLSPGAVHEVKFGYFIDGAIGRNREKYPAGGVRVEFEFTDSNGVRWSRTEKEDPVEILEGPGT